jgi:hypothetical protein
MEKDLIKYEAAVGRFAAKKRNFEFSNKDNQHASIVISTLIEYAQEVRFFVKNLDGSVTDIPNIIDVDPTESRFISALRVFIASGKSIKIAVKEKNKTDKTSKVYTFLEDMASRFPEQVEVKLATDDFIENQTKGFTIADPFVDFYYMVGDKNSFRINFNRDRHEATCNFNDMPIASQLTENFDKYYPRCTAFF